MSWPSSLSPPDTLSTGPIELGDHQVRREHQCHETDEDATGRERRWNRRDLPDYQPVRRRTRRIG